MFRDELCALIMNEAQITNTTVQVLSQKPIIIIIIIIIIITPTSFDPFTWISLWGAVSKTCNQITLCVCFRHSPPRECP